MSRDPGDRFLQHVIDELRGHMLDVEEPAADFGSAPSSPSHTEVIEGETGSTVRTAVDQRSARIGATAVRLRPEPQASPAPWEESKRYDVGIEVGRGGMGRVLLASDSDLGRRVALKVLLADSRDAETARRFVEEAQVAAQLEHPNIVPVYDFGVLSTGTLYFTMRYVRGRTLKDVLRGLKDPEKNSELTEFTRARLLGIFCQVCMAVAYAHARGVLHRDIKPQNVMIGAHGEVYVMDWGLAKVVGRPDRTEGALRVAGGDIDDLARTLEGTVKGTPQYMSPEQAQGEIERVDERTDVYALGAVLYEILTLTPPYLGASASDVVAMVREEEPEAPRKRAPDRDIPDDLEGICVRSMAREPWRRFSSARELAQEVETFLEGTRERERRRYEALRRVEAARETAKRYAALTKNAVELCREAQAASRALKGWEPLIDKEPIWELEDRGAAAEEAAADAFGEAVHLYTEALAYDPSDTEARAGLAELYYAKFLEAEERGGSREARSYRALVEQYEDGSFEGLLRGDGLLELTCDPPADECELYRYHESGRRLIAAPAGKLGPTPATVAPLPMGSYLLVCSRSGSLTIRVPFLVERCAKVELRVRMRDEQEVPEGFCLIAAGPFVSGGDPEAFGSPPRRIVTLADFAMARFPVTCAEYLDFINALVEQDCLQARARVPRSEPNAGQLWMQGIDSRFSLPRQDRQGAKWEPRWPVTGISFDDAVAYCCWVAERTGLPVRLPTDLEWEKAARGADGRTLPWGTHFDATFCKMWSSRQGRSEIEAIGTFPSDESPYGVRDMAGGVQQWCDGWTDREGGIRVRMGGSWMASAKVSRGATRYGWPPETVTPDVGFRLALSLD